jgi:hypothetical protein
MKLDFSRQIFEKMQTYGILRKSVQWGPSCSLRTDIQTNRHDEAESRFSKFCERVHKTAYHHFSPRTYAFCVAFNQHLKHVYVVSSMWYNLEAHIKYGIQIRHKKTNLKVQQRQIYFYPFIEIFAVLYSPASFMTWYMNRIAIYAQRRSKLHFLLLSFSVSF